jgi:hypothetical protein
VPDRRSAAIPVAGMEPGSSLTLLVAFQKAKDRHPKSTELVAHCGEESSPIWIGQSEKITFDDMLDKE